MNARVASTQQSGQNVLGDREEERPKSEKLTWALKGAVLSIPIPGQPVGTPHKGGGLASSAQNGNQDVFDGFDLENFLYAQCA